MTSLITVGSEEFEVVHRHTTVPTKLLRRVTIIPTNYHVISVTDNMEFFHLTHQYVCPQLLQTEETESS